MDEVQQLVQQLQNLIKVAGIGGVGIGGLVGFIFWRLKRDYKRMLDHCDNTDIHLSERYLSISETREKERYNYMTARVDAQNKNVERFRDDIRRLHQRMDDLKACLLKAIQDKS